MHQGSLGDKDLGIGRSHLLVLLGVHLIRLLGPGHHLAFIAVDRRLRERVGLDDACGPLPQDELDAFHFAPGPLGIGFCACDVSLVAV